MPPVPERVLQYLPHDGNFATTQIDFKNEASKCRTRTCRLQLPFKANGQGNRSAAKTCVGTLIVDLFHVPSIPGIARGDLPKSVLKAAEGVKLAQWHGNVHHEGTLTQMGGDCLVSGLVPWTTSRLCIADSLLVLLLDLAQTTLQGDGISNGTV